MVWWTSCIYYINLKYCNLTCLQRRLNASIKHYCSGLTANSLRASHVVLWNTVNLTPSGRLIPTPQLLTLQHYCVGKWRWQSREGCSLWQDLHQILWFFSSIILTKGLYIPSDLSKICLKRSHSFVYWCALIFYTPPVVFIMVVHLHAFISHALFFIW